MEEENRNLSQDLKLLRGTNTFKSYKEMCSALDIEPAHGKENKQKQLELIETFYKIKKHPDNRITLIHKTQREMKAKKKKKKGFISPAKIAEAKEKVEPYKAIMINNHSVNVFNPYIFTERKTKKGEVIPCYCDIDKYLIYFIKHHFGYTKSDYFYKFVEKTAIYEEILKDREKFKLQRCDGNVTIYNLFNQEVILYLRHFLFNRLNSLEKRGYVEITRGFNYRFKVEGEDKLRYSFIELNHPYVQETLEEARNKFNLKSDNVVWLMDDITIRDYNEFVFQTLTEKIEMDASESCSHYRVISRCYMVILSPDLSKEFLDEIEAEFSFNQNIQNVLTLAFQILRAKKRYNLYYRNKLKGFRSKERIVNANTDAIVSLMDEYLVYRSKKKYELENGTIKRDFKTLEELEEVRKLLSDSKVITLESETDSEEEEGEIKRDKEVTLYLEEAFEEDIADIIEYDKKFLNSEEAKLDSDEYDSDELDSSELNSDE